MKISGHQQSRGYEDGLWKGSEPPLLVAADFYKEFFDLCFIASVGFDDHLIDLLFASILLALATFSGGCSAGAYQQIIKKLCKNSFFISIHKPPASIRFALINHTFAVTVEPFKFSSR